MHLHFEWNPQKTTENPRKHKVSLAEATEVFGDPLALTEFDEDNRATEAYWVTLGQVQNLRLVVLIHTWREQNAQIAHVRLIDAQAGPRRPRRARSAWPFDPSLLQTA
ncbi:BrnT family toxin [Immundisolibacter sp.]